MIRRIGTPACCGAGVGWAELRSRSQPQTVAIAAPRARRGTLMLQTLVTISLTMVIFALIVGCMHQLLRVNSLMRTSAAEGLILTRLESSFRRDVRLATTGVVADGVCSLRCMDGRTASYSANGRVVELRWTKGNESGTDYFRCSRGWQTAIEKTDDVIRLMLSRQASQRIESNPGSKRKIVIEARLGAHDSGASNAEKVKQ